MTYNVLMGTLNPTHSLLTNTLVGTFEPLNKGKNVKFRLKWEFSAVAKKSSFFQYSDSVDWGQKEHLA